MLLKKLIFSGLAFASLTCSNNHAPEIKNIYIEPISEQEIRSYRAYLYVFDKDSDLSRVTCVINGQGNENKYTNVIPFHAEREVVKPRSPYFIRTDKSMIEVSGKEIFGFIEPGRYNLSIKAEDKKGNISFKNLDFGI